MKPPKSAFGAWWGVVLPVVILIVADLGLPDDCPWWVGWLCAAVSLGSYAAGYVCGKSDARSLLDETIRQKDSELAKERKRSERLSSALEESKRQHRRDIATYQARLEGRGPDLNSEGVGWWRD